MQDRLAARAKADAAIAYVDGRPNDFGGAYFTQNTGNLVLYVLPAEGIAPGILDSAIALVPEGLETKVQAVKTSMAELVQAEQRLLLRRDELQINELAIQVKENGLEMVLAPTAKASLSAGLAAVPVAISFGPGPQAAVCNDSSSCTPYRGGIGIFSPQANEFCTWGFLQVQVTDGVDRNTFDAGASAISDSMTAQSRRSY